MPSIWIPTEVYGEYAEEYGWSEAKDRIKTVVRENTPEPGQ